MDPNAALDELRAIVARVMAEQRITQETVERGAELFAGLDGFLSSGGFLPRAWAIHGVRPLTPEEYEGTSAAEHGGE